MVIAGESIQVEVERILHSETFRNSDVLRRLLRFLADKTISGEADQLKEYSVGIDALGKPSTYDPRQDSVVRIQVGRLRQKLAEYYRSEGKDDPIVIDIPRGRYKLASQNRLEPPPVENVESLVLPEPLVDVHRWRRVAILSLSALLMALAWGTYASVQLAQERAASAPLRSAWTPELRELWQPFLATTRPLVLAVPGPLFVGIAGAGRFRDINLNTWDDVLRSPEVAAIRKALNNPPIVPRYNYTGIRTVASALHLGRILALSPVNVSVIRSGELSWQQLADNNILFIGTPDHADQLKGLPAAPEIKLEKSGIKVLSPGPGEPGQFPDHPPSMSSLQSFTEPNDGEVHALVTHMPGPGGGFIRSFSSNNGPGMVGAVQWFTNPNLSRILAAKLRKPNGELPRYYQVVLKVKYKDSVPTEILYVLHRELRG